MSLYEVPSDINDLFERGSWTYRILDYTIDEMDNMQAMDFFLEHIGCPAENIHEHTGTQVILKHKDYPQMLCVDSSGLGDFYSHGFSVSMVDLPAHKVLTFADPVNDGRGNISISCTAADGYLFRICNYWTGYGFKGWIVDQNKYTGERRPFFDDVEAAKTSMEDSARSYYEGQYDRYAEALARTMAVLGYDPATINPAL